MLLRKSMRKRRWQRYGVRRICLIPAGPARRHGCSRSRATKKIDAIRKQRRPEPEDIGWGPEHEPDQEDVIGLQQESEKLGNAIAQLPEKQRLLLERAYFADMSHSEIADVTGLPLGTIKSRIRLALERLRHSMT